MSVGFWGSNIVMAALAAGFVAAPLIKHKRRIGSVGVAAALPLFSIGLYLVVGSPQAAGIEPTMRTTQTSKGTAPSNQKKAGSVASMVDGLAARLKADPDDSKGWLLLARSYNHLQRTPEARDAYLRAAALGEYDEKLAMLLDSPAPGESSSAQVSGDVQLSARSREIVLPTDTVFIFARAVGGPAMPVAVLQRSASDLPLNFVLSDTQAMSADAKLSDFEQVIVTARITRSGPATEALQGLEARSEAIVVSEKRHLNLIID